MSLLIASFQLPCLVFFFFIVDIDVDALVGLVLGELEIIEATRHRDTLLAGCAGEAGSPIKLIIVAAARKLLEELE